MSRKYKLKNLEGVYVFLSLFVVVKMVLSRTLGSKI